PDAFRSDNASVNKRCPNADLEVYIIRSSNRGVSNRAPDRGPRTSVGDVLYCAAAAATTLALSSDLPSDLPSLGASDMAGRICPSLTRTWRSEAASLCQSPRDCTWAGS